MIANNKILVIAAHPDDEILGCGGTIAKFIKLGCEIEFLILAEGETARDNSFDLKLRIGDIKKRESDAKNAAEILGVGNIQFDRLPDNRMDQVHLIDITKIIEKKINQFQPEIIFTHNGSDLNIDHRITFQATLTACRPMPDFSVKQIYSWENLSSSEWSSYKIGPMFNPNVFFEVTNTLKQKKEALSCYQNEMRPFPHPRSWETVEALLKFRGASSGVKYAEAFELVRYCF